MQFYRRFCTWLMSVLSKGKNEQLQSLNDVAVSTIEGQNNFADIMAWFQAKIVKDQDDEFFIADFRNLDSQLGVSFHEKTPITKPCAILVGVIRKKNASIEAEVFQCDALDAETKETLGDEKFVIID